MATTSSNSSFRRRQQLFAEYVILPQVGSHIRIESYIKLAYSYYNEGLALFESKYYVRSYVEYKKFTELSLAQLPNHKSYPLIVEERTKLLGHLKIAMAQLQKIARIMDEEQDERLRNEEILALVDAFDDVDEREIIDQLAENCSTADSGPPPYDFDDNTRMSPRSRDQFSHEEKITIDRFSEKSRPQEIRDELPHIWTFEKKEETPVNGKRFEDCIQTLQQRHPEKEEEKNPYYQFVTEYVQLGETETEADVEEKNLELLSVRNR